MSRHYKNFVMMHR